MCRSLAWVALVALAQVGCSFDESGLGLVARSDGIAPPRDGASDQHPGDGPRDARVARDGAADVDGPRVDGLAGDLMSTDVSADALPADTLRPGDTSVDTKPPDTSVDVRPPDTSVDSTPPLLVNESFGSGFGVLQSRLGTWNTSNGSARQSNTSPNGATLSAPVSVANYEVESVVRIHGIAGLTGIGEGAGIAARIQPPLSGQAGKPAQMYACIVSVDSDVLTLVYASGVGTYFSALGSQQRILALNTPYKLRLRVVGSQLTCSLPDLGLTITRAHTGISSAGQAGLVTLYADASWEYLTVTGL